MPPFPPNRVEKSYFIKFWHLYPTFVLQIITNFQKLLKFKLDNFILSTSNHFISKYI